MSMNYYTNTFYGLYVPIKVAKKSPSYEDFYLDSQIPVLTNDFETVTIFKMNTDGSLDTNNELDSESVFLIPCDRQPNMLRPTYASIEDMAAELASIYGDFLPDSYDYVNSIVYCETVAYG